MKFLYFAGLFIFFSFYSKAQHFEDHFRSGAKTRVLTTTQTNAQLHQYNFSKLFTLTENSAIYGAIGNNYQRLRIKFITVTKDSILPGVYHVYGKSMVKNTIDEFEGTIKITYIISLVIKQHGCEDEYKYKGYKGEYSLFGNYEFIENKQPPHSGEFKGKFRTDYFISKNNLPVYDDIEDCSDSYTNNQFIGTWKSYITNLSKVCKWGDYRIPDASDFDIGAGDFSPNTHDTSLGWQTIHDMGLVNDNNKSTPKALRAKRIEEAQWWK